MKKSTLLKTLLMAVCLMVGVSSAWADPVYKNDFTNNQIIWLSTTNVDAAITASWMAKNTTATGSVSGQTEPTTGDGITAYRIKSWKDKHIDFYVTGVAAITFYAHNPNGSSSRTMKATVNETSKEQNAVTLCTINTNEGSAWGSGTVNLTAGSNNFIRVYADGDLDLYAMKITLPAAANDPVNPTFTPDGGSIEGNSTVTVASTYAQKIFYYWSDISTAPSQGDASYTEAEGASADVTAPNEAGTKYLHAYGWNNKNTNTYTSTITKTFTITEGKELPGLEYAVAEVAKYTTDANFTNTLTNPHDLTVTYSVEDGATATGVEVNASTGEVTIGSVVGTATIKASFAGDETYQAGEATYVLTVTKPTCAVPTYTLGSYNYEQGGYEIIASCATDGATLQYKIGSGDYTACTAGVAFYAKNGKLVIKASKDGYNDATIASGIQWTLNDAPSSTSPETLIPFQTSSDDGEKNKAHIYKSVTFGENNNASSVGGVSGSNGLKLRTNQTHGDFANSIKFYVHSGYKVTNIHMTGKSNNSSTGQTIDVNGMYIDGGDNTIGSVAGNKTFPISSADAATFDTGDIEATDNIVLTFDNTNVSSGNKQLKVDIVVTYEVTSVSTTFSSDADYASFSSTYNLDFSGVVGLEAYIATSGSETTVSMKKVDDAAAGTGLVLKGTAGTTYNIPVVASATDHSGENKLWAITSDQNVTAAGTGWTNYVLAKQNGNVVFAPVTGENFVAVTAGHAALCLANPSSARAVSMVFDGETTGIENLTPALSESKETVYNLRGQRVAQPTKGLYIVNGKKVVIK